MIRVFKSATLTRYPLKAGSYPSSCPKTDRLRDRDLESDLDLDRDLDRDDLERDRERLSDRLLDRLRDLLPIAKKISIWKIKIQKIFFCFEEFFLWNRSIRILTEVKDKATLGYNIIDRWRYKQLFLAFF